MFLYFVSFLKKQTNPLKDTWAGHGQVSMGILAAAGIALVTFSFLYGL